MTALLWLRRDLRRHDHPALAAAHQAAAGRGVLVTFVLDPDFWDDAGPVRQAWLARTLIATNATFDGRLCLRMGNPVEVIPALMKEVEAGSVHVSRETEPGGHARDERVQAALDNHRAGGSPGDALWVESGTPYAVEPGTILNQQGTPFQVFTPFSKAWREHGWPEPVREPRGLRLLEAPSDPEAWAIVQTAAIRDGLPDLPEAGEAAAVARWAEFLADDVAAYKTNRDRPDLDATSRLSPYLKFGVVHPRTLLADLALHPSAGATSFINELAWREFYADVLWHHPTSLTRDLKPALAGLAYDVNPAAFEAWKAGRTGYPIVDAGMRQLLQEGWMHNRVRMITASFLTKDLHQWWPAGAAHFLEHRR